MVCIGIFQERERETEREKKLGEGVEKQIQKWIAMKRNARLI